MAGTTEVTVTLELLEALLSPEETRRRQAECYWNGLTVEARCQGLVNRLSRTRAEQQPPTKDPEHLQHLQAVLLRRLILKLTCMDVLESHVAPLLHLWNNTSRSNNDNNGSSNTRDKSRVITDALGNCVAEICAVLSLLEGRTAQTVTRAVSILQRHVLPAVRNAMTNDANQCLAAVRLWRAVATRAGRAFCETPGCIDSIPSILLHVQSQQQQPPQYSLQARVVLELTQLTVAAAVAATTTHPQQQQQHADLNNEIPWTETAAALGRTCLLPLLLPSYSYMIQNNSSNNHNNDTEFMVSILQSLDEAACEAPAFLAANADVLQAVVHFCSTLLQQPYNASTHVLGLQAGQVLVSLMQHEYARRLLKNGFGMPLPEKIIDTCIHVMVTGMDGSQEFVQEWSHSESLTNSSYSDNLRQHDFGDSEDAMAVQQAEELLTLTVYHWNCMDAVLKRAETLLLTTTATEWAQHRMGLVALECCLQAAPVGFRSHLPTATNIALAAAANTSGSSHLLVQYEAIQLAGMLCEAVQEDDLERYLETFATRLLETFALASRSACAKTAAVACRALVSLCRGANNDDFEYRRTTLAPYVLPSLPQMLQILLTGPLSVHERSNVNSFVVVAARAVNAVACLAQVAGEDFVPFYNQVMPVLLTKATSRMSTQNSEASQQLAGCALEAATIVGQALGEDNKDVFVADASRIMTWAVSVLTADQETEHFPKSQLLAACARIASVMGEGYGPYTEIVLRPLLKTVSEQADVEVSEGDEETLEGGRHSWTLGAPDDSEESMTVTVPGRGLTKVTINTSKIQEKAQAIRAIYEHAAALQATFGPYAKECMDEILPLTAFPYSSEVRSTAAQTLAAIFESACCYGEDAPDGMTLASRYLFRCANAIAGQLLHEETAEMEVLQALAQSLSSAFLSVYSRRLTFGNAVSENYSISNAQLIVQLCMKAMVSCLQRRQVIAQKLSENNNLHLCADERNEYENELESETILLTPLVDTVGYNLKLFRQDFCSVFEAEVAPVLGKYLQAGDDIRARVAAVCLFDDCVEHCGPAAASAAAPLLIHGALAGLDDSKNGGDADLKRASLYGIAQMARYAPKSVLAPYSKVILEIISSIVSTPKEDSENYAIFENAISALASLVLIGNAPFKNDGLIKPELALGIFLSNLPLREDEDEARFCHSGFCDLIESGAVNAVSECSRVVFIVGESLAYVSAGEELLAHETAIRFVGILCHLQREADPEIMRQSFGAVSPEAQSAIQEVLNNHAHHCLNVVTP